MMDSTRRREKVKNNNNRDRVEVEHDVSLNEPKALPQGLVWFLFKGISALYCLKPGHDVSVFIVIGQHVRLA